MVLIKRCFSVKFSIFFLVSVLCLFLPISTFASGIKATKSTLSNGLELVVIENHRAPVVTHMVWFRAGSADEPPGVSGVAHYLEHMMFKGAKGLKAGEYSKTVESLGGKFNAFTGRDYTAYHVTIDKKYLDKIMSLEAKRLKYLKPELATFDNEREVIVEERRMRVENHPSSRLKESARAVLFAHHPYRLPIIGWKHEMLELSYDDIMDFYKKYYRPDNAVIVMAGDITASQARKMAEKYFGNWKNPKSSKIKREWVSEPERETSEYVNLSGDDVRQSQWFRQYQAPSLGNNSKDIKSIMARIVLAELIGGGNSSLMHEALVVREKKAISATASYDAFALGPGVFSVSIIPSENILLQEVEHHYMQFLRLISGKGFSSDALLRAKNRLKAETIYARDGIENIAFIFGQLVMLGLGDEFFNGWSDKIDAVSADDVLKALREQMLYSPSVTGRLMTKSEAQKIAN